MEKNNKSVTFVSISGINFPYFSRSYLMSLIRDVVKKHRARFVVVAGNTVAGRRLENELKHRIKEQREFIKKFNASLEKGNKKEKFTNDDKRDIEMEFIEETALSLDEFLPKLGVNYHIVLAEKIYDRPIGVAVLEKLQKMRDDIRLIYDTEAKIPINISGLEDIRVIVPLKQPWFYKIITGLMQRLIDSFVQRTFSPRPSFILVGCTGTGAHLPYYKGIPCFSIPTLHKINEQTSTENMVGCLVVKVSEGDSRPHIVPRTYDFRTAIFSEREFAVAKKITGSERVIINALKPSAASLRTLIFRINGNGVNGNSYKKRKKKFSEKRIKKLLETLCERKIVALNEESNRYGISDELVKSANMTLDDLLKGNKVIKHAVLSCTHFGALKTLYFTILNNFPKLASDVDAIIFNGDVIQGISHNYEYNGELLPIAYGYDKQEILSAHIVSRVLWRIFEKRFKDFGSKKLSIEKVIKSCLVKTVINLGNHDCWENYSKNALPLSLFEERLKRLLTNNLFTFCEAHNLRRNLNSIENLVNQKIIRVGENKVVKIDEVLIGLKHPHKSRTISKSHRIQEVAAFFSEQRVSKDGNPSLIYVANFHEAVAVHVSIFGKTTLGVMTGAYLKDSQFENNKDKVVDYGPAKVTVSFNKKQELIYTEVEFDSSINNNDKEVVLADRLKSKDILKLCSRLCKVVNLPWR